MIDKLVGFVKKPFLKEEYTLTLDVNGSNEIKTYIEKNYLKISPESQEKFLRNLIFGSFEIFENQKNIVEIDIILETIKKTQIPNINSLKFFEEQKLKTKYLGNDLTTLIYDPKKQINRFVDDNLNYVSLAQARHNNNGVLIIQPTKTIKNQIYPLFEETKGIKKPIFAIETYSIMPFENYDFYIRTQLMKHKKNALKVTSSHIYKNAGIKLADTKVIFK